MLENQEQWASQINEMRIAIRNDQSLKEQALKSQGIIDQIELSKDKIEKGGVKSRKLTSSLDSIDEFRRGLLSESPINGLEISNGKIVINNIELEDVNTADLLTLSLEVAMLRMSEDGLRVVFVDNLERLDAENQGEYFAEAKANDIQIIGGLVGAGELKNLTDKDFELS